MSTSLLCSAGVRSKRKADGSARLPELRGTEHDVHSEGSTLLGTAQPGALKVLGHLFAFFASLRFSPPSSFPLPLSVAILRTPDPRQRYLGSLLVLPLRSCRAWSLLPRSPASHSCTLHPQKTIPDEPSWESYCGGNPLRYLLAVLGMTLKAGYETHACPLLCRESLQPGE